MVESVFELRPVAQHYAWGGYDFIPRLMGIENAGRRPFAELWIGAHEKAPSMALLEGGARPLGDLLEAPLAWLLKVLDARQMLSIQAHPSLEQAREGFLRENAAGVGVEAAHRNYRDANHKPEVHVALTEFWMLHGFRPEEEIAALAPELGLEWGGNLREFYGELMRMEQARVDELLEPLLARLGRGTWEKDRPEYWALRAAREFPLEGGHRDRGIFSCFLLNLVHLQPGEGTYQPAGVLHAYLEGVNVELMANSDNVLRGGLTPKHVDVDELLRVVRFEGGRPRVLRGEAVSPVERVYRTGAAEFELSVVRLGPGQAYEGRGEAAYLVMEGGVRAGAIELGRGGVLFAKAGCALEAGSAGAVVWRAGNPDVLRN